MILALALVLSSSMPRPPNSPSPRLVSTHGLTRTTHRTTAKPKAMAKPWEPRSRSRGRRALSAVFSSMKWCSETSIHLIHGNGRAPISPSLA